MTTHDFLANYDAKVMEYLLAVSYLLLFVPMWRFVHGGARVAEAVAAQAPHRVEAIFAEPARAALGWFHAPGDVALHPGHAWARTDGDGLVTVGMDDFAQKLVDPATVVLPSTGGTVVQGRPAFAVGDQAAAVWMASPVDGEVVAVNRAALEKPETLRDPYGAGWLFKVKATALEANQARLHAGEKARAFLERAAEALSLQLQPQLGTVLQDGGTPIQGIAKALAGDGWSELASRLLEADPSQPEA